MTIHERKSKSIRPQQERVIFDVLLMISDTPPKMNHNNASAYAVGTRHTIRRQIRFSNCLRLSRSAMIAHLYAAAPIGPNMIDRKILFHYKLPLQHYKSVLLSAALLPPSRFETSGTRKGGSPRRSTRAHSRSLRRPLCSALLQYRTAPRRAVLAPAGTGGIGNENCYCIQSTVRVGPYRTVLPGAGTNARHNAVALRSACAGSPTRGKLASIYSRRVFAILLRSTRSGDCENEAERRNASEWTEATGSRNRSQRDGNATYRKRS